MNATYLKALRIIYFALAMGIVLFMLVSLLLNKLNGPLLTTDISPTEKAPFLIVLIVFTGAVLMVHRVIMTRKRKAIQNLNSLDQKLVAWRELNVLQGALIEAPAFFAIVLFMLLGIYILLLWPLAGISLFWLSQPTRDKLISDAGLSLDEVGEFDNMI